MRKLVHDWNHEWLKEQRPLSGLALKLITGITSKEEVDSSQRVRLVAHVIAYFGAFSRVDPSHGEDRQNDLAMIVRIKSFYVGAEVDRDVRDVRVPRVPLHA